MAAGSGRDSQRLTRPVSENHERFAELIRSNRTIILDNYKKALEESSISLVEDPCARDRIMAVSAEILNEAAASTQVGRILADDEQSAPGGPAAEPLTGQQLPGQQPPGPHSVSQQLVGQQTSLAETLRAAAIFFEVAVDALSYHATSEPALLPGFVTCVSVLNESLNKRIRRATGAYTRHLAEHIHRAQLDERRRIARELHDRLGEGLSVALRQLELLEIYGPQRPEAAGQRNSPAKDAILETMNRLRAITSDLRAEPVASLEKALTRHLDSMVADADVRLRISGEEKWATPAIIDQVFLVLCEALRNALTHAAPQLVKVAVDFSPEALRASVHDNGCGFVPRDVDRRHPAPAGLASMRERTALIGGALTISSAPARGTYVDLYVPLSGHCADRPSLSPARAPPAAAGTRKAVAGRRPSASDRVPRPGSGPDASVGTDVLAAYPRPVRAGQQGHHAGDVLRLAEPSQRCDRHRFREVRPGVGPAQQIGVRGARRDDVRGYPPDAEGERRHLRKVLQGTLAAGIKRGRGCVQARVDSRNRNNPAPVTELGTRIFNDEERPFGVHCHTPVV